MKNTFIIFNLILFSFVNAECYELNQSECLYWSDFCEWNEETGQWRQLSDDEVAGNTPIPEFLLIRENPSG